ncbi:MULTISPECIES: GNAT family N-acetyltransferase [unclassified Lactobacillus]|uniref:GNAT family N-acetyltransferase n=2 Tax=Lactobacillus TaxID=1578 RepID=UPI0018DCAB9E|nr:MULTISPECIES: GNAT family protein [unclassified Lactobacillus]MBH9990296.1 GNAT family N-acetyltransferase [Lactobacillus sp. M0392]MBI0024694.1 GNAT family N-acetyltransferase [Lactobacillus sp. W8171]MBI0045258.1 GNAT family N-acetyltransferase [Lactobacillus sp. M0393]
MFTIGQFTVNNLEISLVLPEVSHAEALYKIIVHDRDQLAHFLPWAGKIASVKDEVDFIKAMRVDTANYKKLVLVVLVNGKPVGMVDLHNIKLKNESGEIGYWLGQKYQGNGIMTQAVKKLVDVSFNQFGLHSIKLLADHNNKPSRAIAERLHFEHVARLKDEVKYHGKFCDMELYITFNPKN